MVYDYFYYDLETDALYEMYGTDQEGEGITSALNDGVIQGGQITLWYWLYTT